jgi:rubrerythrin
MVLAAPGAETVRFKLRRLVEIPMKRMISSLFLAATIAGVCALAPVGFARADVPKEAIAEQMRRNLETGLRDEAYVSLRYRAYAKAARGRGELELAKLFEDTADVELGHFMRIADAYGLAGTDIANLAESAAEEHFASTRMYVGYADLAEKAGDKESAKLFRRLAMDEDDHYQALMGALAKTTEKPKLPGNH